MDDKSKDKTKKPKGKPRGNPAKAMEGNEEFRLTNPKDTNQQALGYYLILRDLPKPDLHNPTDIENTINAYLAITYEHKMRPGMESLAIAMHTSSSMLRHIAAGREYRNERSVEVFRQFKSICEAAIRDGMLDAKNPAGFIFELKAHHGWQDVQKIQVEQKDAFIQDETTVQAIEQKYLASIAVDVEGKEVVIAKPKEVVIDAEDLRKPD